MHVIFVLVLALAFGGGALYNYGTVADVYAGEVTYKERVVDNEGNSHYLIGTETEVFSNVDTIFHLKWNSRDFQSRIVEGRCYDFKVYGFRVPILTMHRVIIDYKEVPCK